MTDDTDNPQDVDVQPVAESAQAPVLNTTGHHSLMEIFETPTFWEMIRLVRYGLTQPKDTGEHKYAMLQIQRLLAPVSAIVIPVIAVLILVISTAMGPQPVVYELRPIEPEPVKEELEKVEEIEQIEPPDPLDLNTEVFEAPGNSEIVTPSTAITTEKFSAQPADVDAVQMVKSPVVMKGIYSSRTPGMRGKALASYGGSGSTETAVLRALRWLKKVQETDGSWTGKSGGGTYGAPCAPAMTALALLAYLAHGETPASEEFGPTVERAMKWLLSAQDAQGRFKGSDGHEYSLPIAAYALCEAYALTKIPMLREAAEKSIEIIIKGQHPSGGWDYNMRQTSRRDTSVMAWCTQALKAAQMAGLTNPGLAKAIRDGVKGLKTNAAPSGGFGYAGPGAGPLTGASVLGMQLLGASKDPLVKASLDWMVNNATCKWDKPWGGNPIYYWYYTTQAFFHAGEPYWTPWNNMFKSEIVNSQQILKGAGVDGKDIGFWEGATKGEHASPSLVYNTTLCTLMLEVYYRYLPTYKPPEDIVEEAAAPVKGANVDITF
jgi:hypothetical protein